MEECVCGATITRDDDLCESCLMYCAKALGLDTETFEDDHGMSRYFEVLRFAWDHTYDLQTNQNNLYWTQDDLVGEYGSTTH